MIPDTIDISYWQHHPDFNQIKAYGVSRVIMKALDAETGHISGDSVFVANRDMARSVGLSVGAYLFNGPIDPVVAADALFSFSEWRPGDVLALDIENFSGGVHCTPEQAYAWTARIISHGVPASSILIYMNSDVLRNSNWSAVAGLGTRLWIAYYGSNDGTPRGTPPTGPWGSYGLWQYTSVGSVPGISGSVDMNINGTLGAGIDQSLLIEISKTQNQEENNMQLVQDTNTGGAMYLNDGQHNFVRVQGPAHTPILEAWIHDMYSIPVAGGNAAGNAGDLVNVRQFRSFQEINLIDRYKRALQWNDGDIDTAHNGVVNGWPVPITVATIATTDTAALAIALAAKLPAPAVVDINSIVAGVVAKMPAGVPLDTVALSAAIEAVMLPHFASIPTAVNNDAAKRLAT